MASKVFSTPSEQLKQLIIIFCERKSFSFIPCLEAEIMRGHKSPLKNAKRVDSPPYGTPLSAVVDFCGDVFFINDMNLYICPCLFAFNLKSKFLYLYVKKIK